MAENDLNFLTSHRKSVKPMSTRAEPLRQSTKRQYIRIWRSYFLAGCTKYINPYVQIVYAFYMVTFEVFRISRGMNYAIFVSVEGEKSVMSSP